LSESCFNNSIFLALFDVYGYKYTKMRQKYRNLPKKLLYFYRKIWILHQNIPLMQAFTLL